MKHFKILLLLLVAAVLLCGCAQGDEEVYTVTRGDYLLTVDTVNQTIFDGVDTYRYTVSGNTTTITYPNGASYHRMEDGSDTTEGEYDAARYISGDVLCGALVRKTAVPKPGGNPVVGLIIVAIGAFFAGFPDKAWHLTQGRKDQDADPTKESLAVTRVGGIAVIVIGIVVCFM